MQIMEKTDFLGFRKALKMGREKVIKKIENSKITGRGGANFPVGRKWRFTSLAESDQKFVICNFDEGEPGTFKDKFIGDNNPDRIIEGIAIASFAIEAKMAFIYLRGEYSYLKDILSANIKKYQHELKKIDLELEIFLGAGAYICGEESAIMNSIEGYRGEPRSRPPYPAQKGLWEKPTLINNLETLAHIPLIILDKWKNLPLFSLSGNVENPGVFEMSEDASLEELIKRGNPKKKIKAIFLGAGGGCIPYNPHMKLGEAKAIIAIAEDQPLPPICKNIAEFFLHESCGKCTPCREGTARVVELLKKIIRKKHTRDDIRLLEEIVDCMKKTSFCGLGQTAGLHLEGALKHFREEFI